MEDLGGIQRPKASSAARRGFSIIELLIVIAISLTLSTFVIEYTGRSRTQVALQIEAIKFAQVVSRVKSQALAAYTDPTSPCGFGVHVDYGGEAYSTFSYSATDCASIPAIDPASASYHEIDRYALPAVVRFDGSADNALEDILFIPPDPTIELWDVSGTPLLADGIVSFATRDGLATSSVRVSPAGQVQF